jgi:hypothetical protein
VYLETHLRGSAAQSTMAMTIQGAGWQAGNNNNKEKHMPSDIGRSEAIGSIEPQAVKPGSWDPYLVSAVSQCQGTAGESLSENTAVVFDELDASSSRRSAVMLQLQGKNLA